MIDGDDSIDRSAVASGMRDELEAFRVYLVLYLSQSYYVPSSSFSTTTTTTTTHSPSFLHSPLQPTVLVLLLPSLRFRWWFSSCPTDPRPHCSLTLGPNDSPAKSSLRTWPCCYRPVAAVPTAGNLEIMKPRAQASLC